MDVEYDYNFDNLKSKINNIYNEYEKYKDSFNNKNIANKNVSKFQNYKMNLNKNNKKISHNGDFFNKTFRKGLPKNKSLLDNSSSLNDQNQSYIYNAYDKKVKL